MGKLLTIPPHHSCATLIMCLPCNCDIIHAPQHPRATSSALTSRRQAARWASCRHSRTSASYVRNIIHVPHYMCSTSYVCNIIHVPHRPCATSSMCHTIHVQHHTQYTRRPTCWPTAKWASCRRCRRCRRCRQTPSTALTGWSTLRSTPRWVVGR